MNNANIIRAGIEHIAGILEVDSLSFSTPWSRNSFEYDLSKNSFAVYFAALDDDRVIGYGGLHAILGEGQITNIAVHPDFRKTGVGEMILSALIGWSCNNGIKRMTLEVRKNNKPAIALYEKYDFICDGTRKNYYEHPKDDAILMSRDV